MLLLLVFLNVLIFPVLCLVNTFHLTASLSRWETVV